LRTIAFLKSYLGGLQVWKFILTETTKSSEWWADLLSIKCDWYKCVQTPCNFSAFLHQYCTSAIQRVSRQVSFHVQSNVQYNLPSPVAVTFIHLKKKKWLSNRNLRNSWCPVDTRILIMKSNFNFTKPLQKSYIFAGNRELL
jgi:hypothetical protein